MAAEAAPPPAADGATPLVPMPWHVYQYSEGGEPPPIFLPPEAVLAVFGVDINRWGLKGARGRPWKRARPVPPDVPTTVLLEVLPRVDAGEAGSGRGGGEVGAAEPPAAGASGAAASFSATLRFHRGLGGRGVTALLTDCSELAQVSPGATEGVWW